MTDKKPLLGDQLPPMRAQAIKEILQVTSQFDWAQAKPIPREAIEDLMVLAYLRGAAHAVEVQLGPSIAIDATRYARLRVLGCAVIDTRQLAEGLVSRFTNLDEIIDADLKAHPERGDVPAAKLKRRRNK